MKSTGILSTVGMSIFTLFANLSFAADVGVVDPAFGTPIQNSVPAENCHVLKYDSYFVAQNAKHNIQKINSNLDHPNFAGHFVLVRTELVMETLYLIADCKTGDFFHEKLSADSAKFSLASNELQLKTKDGESTHYEWDGKSWIRGESVTASATPISNTAVPATASPSLLASYDALATQYPASEVMTECAPLQYSSYFRAQENKDQIIKLNPELKKPNFAGTKLLLRTETMFDVVYLLADCKTGKFTDDFLKGNLSFSPSSRLAIIKSTSNKPELMLWSKTQWLKIPDPVLKNKATVKNTLYGEKSALLVENLPNPKHLDTIRFEALKKTQTMESLFHDLGSDTISSGTCHVARDKSPVCDVEVE
jgi:hypothetical protein